MEDIKYGYIWDEDLLLQRQFFEEAVEMLGIQCIHSPPLPGVVYNGYGELKDYFGPAELVGCIFDEHPNQKTLKKQGWVSELQTDSSIIHVPYDTPVEQGSIFIVPSGIDKSKGRVFKVINMQVIMMYPASIACEIAPVYENTAEKSELVHEKDSFSIVNRYEEGDM